MSEINTESKRMLMENIRQSAENGTIVGYGNYMLWLGYVCGLTGAWGTSLDIVLDEWAEETGVPNDAFEKAVWKRPPEEMLDEVMKAGDVDKREKIEDKIIAAIRDGHIRTCDISHEVGINKDELYFYLSQMETDEIIYGEDDCWEVVEDVPDEEWI